MTTPRFLPLGDISSEVKRKAPSDSNIPVYSVTKHDGFVPSLDYFKKQVFSRDTKGYNHVLPGELAYATIHLDEGSIGLCPAQALISPMYTVFCVDKERVDPKYLVRFLKSPFALTTYSKLGKGSVHRRAAIAFSRLASLHIPLPAISEQRRIVAILDKADALHAKRREAIAKLDQLLQSVFLEMFGDPETNPRSWPKVAFGDLLQVKSGNALTAQNMVDGPYAVYGGNGVSGRHHEFMFAEPKIVIGRVGAHCGVVHRTEPQAWITDNALYVSKLLRPLNLTFLQAILSAANFNQFAGRAAQPLVSGSRIYPVESIVPPRDMQDEFERRVGAVTKLENDLRQGLAEFERLFSSLQQRAFSGEL